MKIKRIEHVGVVVKDTESSRRLWEDCFGIPLGGVEENGIRKLALGKTVRHGLASTELAAIISTLPLRSDSSKSTRARRLWRAVR